MDVIQAAREMCVELTKDERFINYLEAKKANDNDKELQEQIGEFNLVRLSLDKALSSEEKDNAKIEELNGKIREIYTAIMANESMINYNNAKVELDDVIAQINQLISKTLSGADPLTCDASVSCGGNCGSCGGCH